MTAVASLFGRFKDLPGGRPLVIAHRGFSAKAPENTLAAFAAALDANADMVELDVTLSRDGHVVVIHDDTLDRSTSGSGPVEAHDLEALRSLDAGSWFHADFAGERIPLLSEVYDLCRDRIVINVELKGIQGQDRRCRFVEAVTDLTSSGNMLDTVLFSSFDHKLLHELRKKLPKAFIGVLAHGDEALPTMRKLSALSYHPDIRHVDAAFVASVHARGAVVLPWASLGDNTTQMMQKCLAHCCDGFFADDPELFRKVITEHFVNE